MPPLQPSHTQVTGYAEASFSGNSEVIPGDLIAQLLDGLPTIWESRFAWPGYGREKVTNASFGDSSVILGWPPAAMTKYCLPFTL